MVKYVHLYSTRTRVTFIQANGLTFILISFFWTMWGVDLTTYRPNQVPA